MTAKGGPPPGFAMVPAWMLWRGLDANELLVYAHLAVFGTFNTGWQVYEECRPSKQTLADGGEMRAKHCTNGKDCDRTCGVYHGTGLSVSTVYRALRGLAAKGIAEGEERHDPVTKAQLPTVYRLTYNNPGTPQPVRVNPHDVDREAEPADGPPVTHDSPPPAAGDTDPLSPMTDNPEPPTQNHQTQKKKTNSSGTAGAEGTARNARGRPSASPPRAEKTSSSSAQPGGVASPAALALLAALPRPWRDVEPWVARQMTGRLDQALNLYGSRAILSAVSRYGRGPGEVFDGKAAKPGEVRALPALMRVLRMLKVDVAGGACAVCGDEHRDRECGGESLLTLVPGQCVACGSPDASVRSETPDKVWACDECWAGVSVDAAAA